VVLKVLVSHTGADRVSASDPPKAALWVARRSVIDKHVLCARVGKFGDYVSLTRQWVRSVIIEKWPLAIKPELIGFARAHSVWLFRRHFRLVEKGIPRDAACA
jgi:hypothetical protein